MEKNETTINASSKRLYGILIAIALLLSVPLIAMQFTNEVNWSPFDFVVMGILLLITGLVCELVIRKAKGKTSRVIICLAVLAVFFLIWAELAIGVFNTRFAGS